MKFEYTLRGEPITLTQLDNVAAVRPDKDLRASGRTAMSLAGLFGAPVPKGPKFGLGVPSKDVSVFNRAGWVFCTPSKPVARAAASRGSVDNADAVRPVFVDPGGNTLIGTDRFIVRLPDEMREGQVSAKLAADGFIPVQALRFAPHVYEVRLKSAAPFVEAVATAQHRTGYVYVEPSFLEVIGGRWTPTDPDFGKQWQHHNTGSGGGTAGADIKSKGAWEKTRGGATPNGSTRPVRIAVIDGGIHVNHPDLKSGITRAGYFKDDGMGGSVFVSGTAGFPTDIHGTFCLGMAGARANNGKGGCGSAPEADLFAVACLPDELGTQATLARAVGYAADPSTTDATASPADGADVISCSLGPNGATWTITSVLSDAITKAATSGRGGRGVPVFWAVTNGSFEIKYDQVASHTHVIAIGRSNRLDTADGSGYGPELAFLAPGRDVYSTEGRRGYGFDTGTSFATPLSAGVAALVLARKPTMSRVDLISHLKANCDKIGGAGVTYDTTGHNIDYGHGRINAEKAVS